MALFVKLNENREIISVLDYKPDDSYLDAVEIKPEIDFRKQFYVDHSIDLDADPITFTYIVGDFTPEERKDRILDRLRFEYTTKSGLYITSAADSGSLNVTAMNKLLDQYNSNKSLVESSSSHDELDSLSLD